MLIRKNLIKIFHLTQTFMQKLLTYNDIVTNANPQLENPISKPDAKPDGEIFSNDVLQSMCTRDLPVNNRYINRTSPASNNLIIK